MGGSAILSSAPAAAPEAAAAGFAIECDALGFHYDEREALRFRHPDAVLVSGETGEGVDALGERLERKLATLGTPFVKTLCP